ncbi:ParB family chromosome partitioning protein [Palleronia aestuarii]|uniref:ParB family chromosome partitioning protein n=1 Tax=Palleronia aestuarii TaxID=568105 RepID=A0A2W7MQV6_9RHOB|nr:ParB N-terminal domain-containing protein [Palleronia aestuarii]PZX10330.1 ParB family chromosome partitioning protein [Palleronia aestuarii]
MSRKRRIFDIDMPDEDFPEGKSNGEPLPESEQARRRGPMATAIGETGEALRDRKRIEDDIRAENDALAYEFVRLKREGLVTDTIPVDRIDTERLTRDRSTDADLDLSELKISLDAIGLSNPIRVVARPDGRYELVEGLRRLSAYRELYAETADQKWSRIPAGLIATGQGDAALYRRMVDENLIRKDISFAEMAMLAASYATEGVEGCTNLDAAVNQLYASVSPQKRSYIRRFAALIDRTSGYLKHPFAVPRALGLRLADLLDDDPGSIAELSDTLRAAPQRTAETELGILTRFAEARQSVVPKKTRGAPKAARRGRVVLSVPVGPGVRCTAADGKMELRASLDFAGLDRARLERAVEAFFGALED